MNFDVSPILVSLCKLLHLFLAHFDQSLVCSRLCHCPVYLFLCKKIKLKGRHVHFCVKLVSVVHLEVHFHWSRNRVSMLIRGIMTSNWG